jgi:hypothetical protein
LIQYDRRGERLGVVEEIDRPRSSASSEETPIDVVPSSDDVVGVERGRRDPSSVGGARTNLNVRQPDRSDVDTTARNARRPPVEIHRLRACAHVHDFAVEELVAKVKRGAAPEMKPTASSASKLMPRRRDPVCCPSAAIHLTITASSACLSRRRSCIDRQRGPAIAIASGVMAHEEPRHPHPRALLHRRELHRRRPSCLLRIFVGRAATCAATSVRLRVLDHQF